MPPAERDRFLALIREKQGLESPALELMSARAPEGSGLEPESAPGPAGRGTELEAGAAAHRGQAAADRMRR